MLRDRLDRAGFLVAALLLGQLFALETAHGAITVDEAIRAHAATLAKIETIYLRSEISSEEAERPPQRMSVTETWRSGTRVRTLQRLFQALTANGLKEVLEANRVTQFSYADAESRNLRGWDPDAPLPLPLAETLRPNDFGQVKAGIGPRDPLGATSEDWAAFLLEITPGQPLTVFARSAQLELVEAPADGMARLRIAQTDQDVLAGGLIDLDPAHGYLIRRMELPEARTVAEVQGFTEFGEGIWLPEKVVRKTPRMMAIATRLAARVNEPIADADLVVAFPEGARVDEVLTKRVHLWGKDGPAHTFDSFQQFLDHQTQQMKLANPLPQNLADGGTNWLLWVNIAGISALMLLMAFRNRLVRP